MKHTALFTALAISSTVILSACVASSDTTSIAPDSTPKNIIMVVADGMGPAFPTAYRYYHDDPKTPLVEQTIFDKYYVGSSSTYPAATNKSEVLNASNNLYVTDSAASATALATGVKTYNGAIGVDVDKQPLLSVLDWAKSIGKKTGIAVTSQIVHATPASYIAKNEHRRNYNAIADDYFDLKIEGQFKVDVMLGGGTNYFVREDRDLTAEFVDSGYQYITDYEQLKSLDANKPVLGLFAEVSLPASNTVVKKDQLTTLTKAAVAQLENDNGFFLLVEASQIDWAAHGNDISYAMQEMQDLVTTLNYLEQYVQTHPDTLVVLTADHNTGGLTLGRDGIYEWKPEYIKNLTLAPATIAKQIVEGTTTEDDLAEQLGFTLTDDELKQFNLIALEQTLTAENAREVGGKYFTFINKLIDVRSHTGWTTGGHTGVDVPVFAFGQNKDVFNGHQDNIDIAKKLFTLMGK
ncbi:alkaline phosphatase [Colwelliaceae bacterium BS250]